MGDVQETERRALGAVGELPSCPRSTLAFVGREGELARLIDLLDDEVLFVIYGVAGIGKSELAYRALERARERPGWLKATPRLIEVKPGMDEHHLVAMLRLRTGADRARADRLGGPARSLAEELEPVVEALNHRQQLVFVDDLHLLDAGAAARVFGHLARRVRRSRLLVASRLEIPFLPESAVPAVIRLAPLDDQAAQRMLANLERRLGVQFPDGPGILRRAGGSPFFLQREAVSAVTGGADAPADRLEATILALPEPAGQLLLRAAVMGGRLDVAELVAGGAADESLVALARHFFLEITDGTATVHDLVRDAVLRLAAAEDVARAHRAVAAVHVARARAGGADGGLAGIEAVRHLCAAGAHDEALRLLTAVHGTISSAGLDHLLLGSLEGMRSALPAKAAAIDLIRARILLRRSLVADAEKVMADLAADPAVAGSVRYLTLAGAIAAQRGDLCAAESCLVRAHRSAPHGAGTSEGARIALHLADVLSLRGENRRARAVLDDVRPLCDALGDRAVVRWGWSAGLSRVLERDFTATVAVVAPFRELADRLGASDLAAQLSMLEVLARAEILDAIGARELTERVVARAARAGALRAPIASFYLGVAAWAEGDVGTAAQALRESWLFLQASQHEVLGPIVGHYLARVCLQQGDARGAAELFERTNLRAVAIGFGSMLPIGYAYHARALIAAGEPDAAIDCAQAPLAEIARRDGAPAYAGPVAQQVAALALAYRGDAASARRLLAEARAAADEALAIEIVLDSAELELCGGDPTAAVEAAMLARSHYAGRRARFLEARACAALAAGCVALGGPGDLVMADEALARAEELAARYDYGPLRLRASLIRSAIMARRGESLAAHHLVSEALAGASGRVNGVELLLLGSALGSARAHLLPAGQAAQLRLLGLDRPDSPLPEIVVDVENGTIASPRGTVKGRPVMSALLACLIDGNGRAVSADTLYRRVWGADEYHPLRHRNALYVAMNRLRQALVELVPEHRGDVVERLPAGWRLGEGIRARKTT